MKNRIASIALTVVMILGCMITNIDFNVNTVCADPYNIEISVETKEISIEEIPDDRRIPLAVNLSNVPDEDFYFLDIAYKLDDKLADYTYHCGERDHLPNISSKVGHMDNCTYYIKADTVFYDNKKIPNGRFYNIYVFIPPKVNEGDYFEISPIPYCYADSYQLDTSFALESNKEEEFGPSNFSFHGGGIKIRSSQTFQSDSIPTENYINPNQQNNEQITQPQIISEISDTTFETTYLTSNTSITTFTKATTSSAVTTKKIEFETSTETITEITTTENINNGENKTNIFLLSFIILLIVAAITITIIIRKRKKK